MRSLRGPPPPAGQIFEEDAKFRCGCVAFLTSRSKHACCEGEEKGGWGGGGGRAVAPPPPPPPPQAALVFLSALNEAEECLECGDG